MDINIFKSRRSSFIGGIILIFTLIMVSIFIFEYKYIGTFLPGVSLGGESLAGRNFAEVSSKLRAGANKLEQEGLSMSMEVANGIYLINIPEQSYGLTPDMEVEYFDIGDLEGALQTAYKKGRSGSIL